MIIQQQCRAKIVATLGPASSSAEMIRALAEAGGCVPAQFQSWQP